MNIEENTNAVQETNNELESIQQENNNVGKQSIYKFNSTK